MAKTRIEYEGLAPVTPPFRPPPTQNKSLIQESQKLLSHRLLYRNQLAITMSCDVALHLDHNTAKYALLRLRHTPLGHLHQAKMQYFQTNPLNIFLINPISNEQSTSCQPQTREDQANTPSISRQQNSTKQRRKCAKPAPECVNSQSHYATSAHARSILKTAGASISRKSK